MSNQNLHTESYKLKNELLNAYNKSLEQGNLNYLVDFYTKNEESLKENYNINLNDILNISGEQIQQLYEPETEESIAPKTDIKPFLVGGFVLLVIGIIIINK